MPAAEGGVLVLPAQGSDAAGGRLSPLPQIGITAGSDAEEAQGAHLVLP